MEDSKLFILIVIILTAYLLFYKNMTTNTTVPLQYKGIEGLDYLKKQYSSQLPQAKSLCLSQFKGEWVDTSNSIGCFNMQGFSSSYCGVNLISNLIKLCNSIGGSPICSSTQASCTV